MKSRDTARIQSIETCGAVDGPGIRYVAFLQGCQFKCRYCHNRDTWSMAGGKEKDITEMLREIQSYIYFYRPNRGGVTVSGGEATLQMPFVINLFQQVKNLNLTTCLDTNGCILRYDNELEQLLNCTDLVLLDIKHMDETQHKKLTGMTNSYTLNFARYLNDKRIPMWIRYVVVPGWTDQESNIHALGKFISTEIRESVEYVDILPYHELGKYKWAQYGETYELENVTPPSAEEIKRIKKILSDEYHLNIR
jgi:pyruvate formate lyase activating enzyme